jgi:hypothetical protein
MWSLKYGISIFSIWHKTPRRICHGRSHRVVTDGDSGGKNRPCDGEDETQRYDVNVVHKSIEPLIHRHPREGRRHREGNADEHREFT